MSFQMQIVKMNYPIFFEYRILLFSTQTPWKFMETLPWMSCVSRNVRALVVKNTQPAEQVVL